MANQQEISILLSLQTANALKSMLSFVGQSENLLGSLASKAAQVGLVIQAALALAKPVEEIINMEESLGRLNERTGISVGILNAMRAEAALDNVSMDELATTLGRFSGNIYEAATNGGRMAQAFMQMHVSLVDQNNALRDTGAVLEDVSNWFAKHEDGAKKARIAQDLFGRSGRALIPVLNQGADALKQMAGADVPVTDKSVALATEFNVRLRQMQENVRMFATGIVNDALPALVKMEGYVDAFPRLFAQAFKDGKLPELLALVIEAGFELGMEAVKTTWGALWKSLTGEAAGQIYLALINAIITFGTRAAQFLLKVLEDPIIAMAGGWDWLFDEVRVGWDHVSNFMKQALAGVLNFFIDGWNAIAVKIGSKPIAKLVWGQDPIEPGKELEKSMQDMLEFAEPGFKAINDYLDQALKTTRDVLGVSGKINASDDLRLTALQRLKNMLEAIAAQHAPKTRPPSEGGGGQLVGPNPEQVKLLQEWLQLTDEVFKVQEKAVQNDTYLTQVQKAQRLIPLIEKQRDLVNEQIAQAEKMKAQLIAQGEDADESKKIAVARELVKLQGQLNDLEVQDRKEKSLTSFAIQFKQTIVELGNTWGSWAQQMATTFKNVFNTAISSISSGLTGLIMGTKTWRQALMDIESTILTQVINAIIAMGVRWVMTQIMMAIFGESIAASSTEALIPIAAAQSAIWATPATLATISSYGAAAAAAPGQIGLAEIATLGISAREFGGPVTAGQPYIVGEKRPELFVPSQNGYIMPSVPAPYNAPQQGGGSTQVNIMGHFVDSTDAVVKRMRDNPEFHHLVVDIGRKNAHVIGSRT